MLLRPLFVVILLSAPGWANAALGVPGVSMPEPVTANVADDYDPSLSRDGRYLAFVSNRGKNTDIWLKVLGEKNIESWLKILRGKDSKSWLDVIKSGKLIPSTLFRITTDSSSDTSPALSPDGKKLTFVSTRSDPKGDIYLLELISIPLKNPQPVRLTGIETADNDPVFSPDGKRIFYTSAPSATRKENIWLYDLSNKTTNQLTTDGGFTPAISADGRYMVYVVREDGDIGGDLVVMRLADKKTVPFIKSPFIEGFPVWDDDNIYFVRYGEDTDRDGKITLEDRSDLYSAYFSADIFEGALPPAPRQLTSADSYDLFPSVSGKKIYFSSSRPGRDQEIYVMDKLGIISWQDNIVEEIQKSYPADKYLPLLVLANFIQDASWSTPKKLQARSLFKRAVIYQKSIGNLRAARDEFQKLIQKHPQESPYPDLARIRLARIEVELARQADRKKAEKLIRQKITELKVLAQSEIVEIAGKALLAIGDFFGMLSDMSSALKAFIQVKEQYSSSPELAAQALFHAGEIYQIFNQDIDMVQGAYLKILTDYPKNPVWPDRAAQAIIEMSLDENMDKSIANLRELQNFYPELMLLSAKAKNRIGQLYEKADKIDRAKREYAGVIQNFTDQKKEIDRARFSLASIYYKQKDYENCLEVYREIEQNTSEREEVFRSARRNFIRRSLEKAKREFLEGEPRLAIKSYLRLIEYDDSILEAHRGVLQVYASLKEIDRVIARLEKRSQAEPVNYIPHYVLGLALTYKDPPDLDGAEAGIHKSLALHFRSPYPHQTLGWIYEQREQVLKEGNFFEKALAEYQIALSLNDAKENPLNQANLHNNIGNCYFHLKSYSLAYDAYQKRAIYPYDDLTGKSIFYQRYGDTAFRTGESDSAVGYYELAMKNALQTDDINRLALLYDKLALASQDVRDYKAAAGYFIESLKYNRKLKNFSNVTLALRNIAYNLYYLSKQQNREKNLKDALDYYQQSLKNLKSYGGKKQDKATGLFKIELEVGGDESGSSAGFDTKGEEKLITTYMGRIYREAGNNHKALEFLERKISLLPGDWEKNVSRASERSIVLNQAGTLAASLGKDDTALDYFNKSFHIANKLQIKTGMQINAINFAQLSLSSKTFSPNKIPQAIRMVQAALDIIGGDRRYLSQKVTLLNSLALLWYNSPSYTSLTDTDTKRIEKSLWELKADALPVALLRGALDLIDKSTGKETMVAKRVMLLANLAQVSPPGSERDEYHRQALDIAQKNGLDYLRWYLMSEDALSGGNFSDLQISAAILEAIPKEKYKALPDDSEQIKELYGTMILLLAKEEKWEEAYYMSERFHRQIYLRSPNQGDIKIPARQPEIAVIQQYLEPDDLLVKFEQIKGETFWWRINNRSFSGGKLSPSLQPEPKELKKIRSFGLSQAERVKSDSPLAGFGLGTGRNTKQTEKFPAAISIEGANRLYLVLPPKLQLIPWEAAAVDGDPLIKQASVVRLGGLGHFVNSYQSRNLAPLKLFWAAKEKDVDISDAGIASGEWDGEGDFIVKAAPWSMVHLNLPMESDFHPARWVIPSSIDIGNRISPFDLSSEMTGKQIAVFFPKSKQTVAQTAQDLSAAGFPSVLAYHGPQKIKNEFLNIFYHHLARNTPAQALKISLSELAGRYPKAADWACASLYGFGGMNKNEQKQFARQRLSINLKNGIGAFRSKSWDTAIGHMEEALAMMSVLEITKNRDKVFRALVDSYYFLKDYPSAISYQKKLIAYYKAQPDPDWEVLADAHHHLGVIFSRAEQFDMAAVELTAALNIYREYEITDKIARSLGTMGVVKESASDYEKALENFQAALKENKQLENVLGVGKQLRRLGRIYYLRLNDYRNAESVFKSAAETFRKNNDKLQLAETTLELGLVRERMADFPGALSYYGEAYQMAQDMDNDLLLSKAAVNMANTAWFQGDYQTAFTRQREALALAEKTNDLRQQQIATNLAGLIYWTLNDYDMALKHLHHALQLAKTMKSKIDIASAYNNIGLVHRQKKDYSLAVENFQHALEIDKSIGSRWGEGYDLRNLGIVNLRLKEYKQAQYNLEAAVRISGEIKNRINEVKALLELGNLSFETKDFPAATRRLGKAARLSKKFVIPEVEWRALMKLGEIAEASDDPDKALQDYREAIEVVEEMRASIKVEEFKNWFLTNKTDLYDKMILLLIGEGKVEEAFNMSERSRARSFIDILGNRTLTLKDTVSQNLIEQRKSLKNRIVAAEKGLSAGVGTELLALRDQYEELLIQIKQQNPQLSAFVSVDPLTYKDVKLILEEDTILLEYHITENKILVWVVKHDSITVRQVEFKKESLKRAVLDYRLLLQNLEAHLKPSYELYQLLIKPILEDIEGVRVVGVAPHGPLHYLAFASLWDGQSYLVENYPLFYVPSASVLKFVSAGKREPTTQAWVLAVGNPDLGSFNYDLPLAEMEVESMKWDFPKVDILIREKATEEWVVKNIGRYDIIHFATHGEFDSINPLFSALKLTGKDNYDGNLEVDEVFSLNLKADMVTLSACQTGLGRVMVGDEIVGLNRAFLYAGTRSILSTLWRVSDLSTAVLIKHFYRNYSHLSKAESLQKAQILVMRYFSHPSYWAGLSLTGDYH